jgi:DNA-binding transcriptional regulator YhcF (GntR family)
VKAYNELGHEGLIESGQGRGTFVSKNPRVVAASRKALLAEELEALLLRAEARGLSAQEVIDALAARVRARENET